MNLSGSERRKSSLLWMSPLASGIILTCIFKAAHWFPGDVHIFMNGDYLGQFMEYIVMFWRKLFSGNGLFYSFDLGLGATTWEHYAFYGFSPFNIVFLFIKDADTAAFILLLSKVCMIAFCMHLFLLYGLKVREQLAVMFSVSYALCAYVINFHYSIIFIDYLYILPLVMLMMLRFLRTGKAGGLTAAYAYSFLTAYYGGYMIGIFSFICFICFLISGDNCFSRRRLILKYFASVIIAVLISSVVTLPTAAAIFAGRSGESGNVRNLSLFIWEVFTDLLPFKKITYITLQPSIYCGLPALIFTIGYFIDKNIVLRRKILAVLILAFLLLCTFFKPAYLMMHGFDEPDEYYFRFAFMYAFYFCSIGATWAEKRKDNSDNKETLAVGITALLMALSCVTEYIISGDHQDSNYTLKMGFLAILMLLYFGMKFLSKGRYLFLYLILFVELFANGYYSLTPDSDALPRWKETYDLWNSHGAEALAKVSESENSGKKDAFYRLNFRGGLWTNDAMYFGYHGLGYFSSMEQRDTRKAMRALGYATSNRIVMEKGGSPFTEMIFAQKYRVETNLDIRLEDSEKLEVNKNDYVLPLGFMVSDDIMGVEMINDAFENQQRLVNAFLGHENIIWNRYDGIVSTECENASITEYEDKVVIKKNVPGMGLVELSVPTDETEEHYAYIARKGSASDQKSPVVYSDAEGGMACLTLPSYLFMPATIKMGNEDGISSIFVFFNEDGYEETDFENCYFAGFNRDGLKNAYDELKEGGLDISEMKDDDIHGTVTVSEGKNILFTSIPYDTGWQIYVDGEITETFSVLDGGFLACRLSAGEHDVHIYYKNHNIETGAVISVVGIVLLICLFVCDRKMILKSVQTETDKGDENKNAES